MSKKVWERYDSDDSDIYSDDGEEMIVPSRSTHTGGTFAAKPSGGYQCGPCKISFHTSKELKSHKIKDPDNHQYCGPCDRDFDSNDQRKMHLIKSPLHIVCEICFKEFKSKGGLEGHRKQMHRVSQRIKCPGCGVFFQNASGIAQHIESDDCERGLDKATLARRIIEAHDPTAMLDIDPRKKPDTTTTHIWRDGIVTPSVKARIGYEPDQDRDSRDGNTSPRAPRGPMPEWHKNRPAPPGSVSSSTLGSTATGRPGPSVLDYTDGIGADEQPAYTLGDMGKYWDSGQRNFLCPHNACRKKFKKADAILQHMSSSVHARKVFRCPTCCDRYKSSSALLQHMESGSCGINQTSQFGDATNTLTGGLIFPM